jgi:diacylglycerol kinase (ATP)
VVDWTCGARGEDTVSRRVRVVVNPWARGGRGPRALRGLEAAAPPGLVIEWVASRSAAHLRDLVAEAEARPEDYDAVAVAGGDGSVRNALAALGMPNRIPLGVIPIGSGNDFACDLGLPRDARRALAVLASGVRRRVDVGRVGADGPRYCCVASVGLDEVALDVVHHAGLPRGRLLNVAAALWALFTYRPRALRIRWDKGSFEGEVMFAAVTNTRGYGGGFLVSPGARVSDGVLDLCVVRRASRMGLLGKFARIMRGTHAGLAEVVLAQSPWFTIEDARGEARAALDGELPDAPTPLALRCQPGGLEVLVPAPEAP